MNCPTCGHEVKERKESLSSGLVNTLKKFHEAIATTESPAIHLQKDTNLTKNEYNNFQKLQYFGLVKKTKQAGYWSLTPKGYDFLAGEPISRTVYLENGIVRRQSTETVRIANPITPYWHKKEDYMEQGGLFQ